MAEQNLQIFDIRELFGRLADNQLNQMLDNVAEVLRPGENGDFMQNANQLIQALIPNENQIGAATLSYLQELYIRGNTFNLYYKDDYVGVGVYEPERKHPEGKYYVNVIKQAIEIKVVHPFFYVYKMQKEDWLSAMIEFNLGLYILEFTEYFLENDVPENVIADMKKTITESNILEKMDKFDIDAELKNKLKERLEEFL